MAQTRIRIGPQLQQSSTNGSIMTSNTSNEAQWSAPSTGADHLWFYDDTATATVPLSLGTNLSITGTTLNATAGAGGYATIQEEGSGLTARTIMNFIGSGITAADNVGQTRTDITLDTFLNTLATQGFVDLTGDVGLTQLPFANMADLAGLSVLGRAANTSGVMAAITAGTDNQVLRRSGTSLGFGAVNLASSDAVTGILDETNGGTGQSTFTTGDILYASAANTLSKLGIGTTGYVLRVASGGIPEWTSVLDLGYTTKNSVRVATTAAGVLATDFENLDTVDGITLATNDRILIKNQAAPAENGIYIVQASGAPVRATDANTWDELVSAYVWVEVGTTNADTGWLCTVDQGGTLETTAVTWTQQSGAGQITAGAGMTKSGNTLDVISGNTGIVVNADDITLTLASNSGLEISSGLKILPDTVTAGTLAITLTANGAGVKYNTTSFTETSETLELAAGVAGGGIDLTAGVLSHTDTSTVANIDTTGPEVIDTMTFDTYGHVTAFTLRNLVLNDINDVTITAVASGDTLTYNGSAWVNTAEAGNVTIGYIEGKTGASVDLDANDGDLKDVDGSNLVLTVTDESKIIVYRNGVRQAQTGSLTTRDYDFSAGNIITFQVSLTSADIVVIEQ